jgi:hypothetical protein
VRDILSSAPKLSEDEWRRFKEAQIAAAPAKRRGLVRYLLFRCGRKAVCWPSDDAIGRELGFDGRTIRRWMNELDALGITERLSVPTRFRRAILFPANPTCEKVLTDVKEAGHSVRLKTDVLSASTRTFCPKKPLTVESENGNLKGGIISSSAQALAQRACEGERPREAKPPTRIDDGHAKIASIKGNGGTVTTPPRQYKSVANLAEAPLDDPVIAAELRAREQARARASAQPSDAEIVAHVLGTATASTTIQGDKADTTPRALLTGDPDASGAMPQPLTESELTRLMLSLSPGATGQEIGLVALKAARALADGHSLRWWRRVAQLVAAGRVPASVFAGLNAPGVRDARAVLNARVRKYVPDLQARGHPVLCRTATHTVSVH